VITADRERARVFALAEAWLARHAASRAGAARPAVRPRGHGRPREAVA
jgi:hypothetical protein